MDPTDHENENKWRGSLVFNTVHYHDDHEDNWCPFSKENVQQILILFLFLFVRKKMVLMMMRVIHISHHTNSSLPHLIPSTTTTTIPYIHTNKSTKNTFLLNRTFCQTAIISSLGSSTLNTKLGMLTFVNVSVNQQNSKLKPINFFLEEKGAQLRKGNIFTFQISSTRSKCETWHTWQLKEFFTNRLQLTVRQLMTDYNCLCYHYKYTYFFVIWLDFLYFVAEVNCLNY